MKVLSQTGNLLVMISWTLHQGIFLKLFRIYSGTIVITLCYKLSLISADNDQPVQQSEGMM